MSNLQERLTYLKIENSEDLELITNARDRIASRRKDIQQLEAQILVNKFVENGSLPDKSFTRLRKDVAFRGVEAMKCQHCEHKPDDARLSVCGHLYCDECFSTVWPGICKHTVCGRRLRKGVEVETTLYEAICTMLKVSFRDDETGTNSSDGEDSLSTPRNGGLSGRVVERAVSRTSQLRSQLFQSYNSAAEGDSEDDGFDQRSQRSVGYADDGTSFVSDDESVDMTASFILYEDKSSTDDSDADISMGSEEAE